MKCSICGRQLKNVQSVELGFGPVCYKRKFGITPRTSRKCVEVPAGKTSGYNLKGQISIEDYLQMLSEQ